MSEPSVAELRELRNRLDGLTIRDAARLGRRLKNARGEAGPEKLRQIGEQITAAEALVATREAVVPTITYPDLPVSDRKRILGSSIDAVIVDRAHSRIPVGDRARILWRGEGPEDLPRRGRDNGPIRPYTP